MLNLSLLDVYSIYRQSENKINIIYGPYAKKMDCDTLFFNIGKSIMYMGCDDPDITEEEAIKKKGSVFIWLTDKPGCHIQSKYLNSLGFKYLTDYNYLEGAHFQTRLKCTTVLDPNLGHGTASNNELGVRIKKNTEAKCNKLAVIGASLVDETFFLWKLWPEIILDLMTEKGMQV